MVNHNDGSAQRSVEAEACDLFSDSRSDARKILPAGLDEEHVRAALRRVSGGPANIQSIYPLTSLQEGMLLHHLLRDSDEYVLSLFIEVRSLAELDRLVRAIQVVINRHDALRTALLWSDLPRAVQVVCRHAALPIENVSNSTTQSGAIPATDDERPSWQ